MPRFIYFTIVIVTMLCTSAAMAQQEEQAAVPLPPEMLYEGQPIDPECVYATDAMERNPAPQDLSVCMKHRPPEISYKSRGELIIQPSGGRGYRYGLNDNPSERDETLERSYTGYFYYQYIGKRNGKLILLTEYSGGGSGHFSYLSEYIREGNILRMDRHLIVGDRCSRGIKTAAMEGNALRYTYHATPVNIFYAVLSDKEEYPKGLNSAFRDCAAEIHMRDDTLDKVTLTVDDAARAHLGSNCFENIYDQTRDAHNGELTGDQARAMMLRFKAECAENP